MRRGYVGIGTVVLTAIWLTGCNSSNFSPPTELIAATSGSSQSAQVNMPFSVPLVATVTMGGQPVSGAFVVFTAPSSGASGTFSNGTNTETDTTGSNGVVTSSTFTANGTIGAVALTASVAGVTATTMFSLTNTSGPPASITATSGSLQSATIGTAFGAPLVATVVDANQYPVNGVTVTFAAPANGPSGVFANTTTTDTETTNANGVATSTTLTANGTTGSYSVGATVAGVATAASFSLSNVAGALVSITATIGTPQSVTVNRPFANVLVATVVNGNQQPVSGVQVTFTAPATGASGTFANGTTLDTETTNASGVATSTTFTANGGVGTYTVTATVPSGAEPANFSLTNTAINFAFYVSGLEAINGGSNFYGLAGSVQVDGNGDVLGGEQDYNDGIGVLSPQPSGDAILPETGALTVDSSTGLGTLVLTTNNTSVGVNGVETLAVQFVNANHALIVQFDGSATSSGSMDAQTLSSTLNDGNYAFTLSGVDTAYLPIVFGGVFSVSSSGTALSGTYDVDDAGATVTPTLGTSFSGTISAPDAFGRGTITGAIGISLNYYEVGPEAIRIIDVDSTDAGIGSVFGQGTGTFSNGSLGATVFGVQSNSLGSLFAAAGMFTVPTSGTLSGVADVDEFDNDVIVTDAAISGTYTVASNGYGSLTIAQGDLGDVSVLGIYSTDPNLNLNDPNNTTSGLGGALIADLDGFTLNGTGVLIPQTDTSTASFAGSYAFGAQTFHSPRGAKLGWEFDFVGQGAVSSGALNNASGLLSDPFFIFNATGPDGTDTAKFTGTTTPDPTNAGRYTMKLGITVAADPVNFNTVIYQAGGGQLFWLNADKTDVSVFLGVLEQQGSLVTVPALAKTESAQER